MLVWQNVPRENNVVGHTVVDTEFVNNEIYRKMSVKAIC
jgi:hypothetical protein